MMIRRQSYQEGSMIPHDPTMCFYYGGMVRSHQSNSNSVCYSNKVSISIMNVRSTTSWQVVAIITATGGEYHHHLQKYLIRVSESLKKEMGSHQDATGTQQPSLPKDSETIPKVR